MDRKWKRDFYRFQEDDITEIVKNPLAGKNELKTAGTYIIDFNAANYASGVYFYRIEAEELGGNKFVDSKKMVLLK